MEIYKRNGSLSVNLLVNFVPFENVQDCILVITKWYYHKKIFKRFSVQLNRKNTVSMSLYMVIPRQRTSLFFLLLSGFTFYNWSLLEEFYRHSCVFCLANSTR